MPYEIKNNTFSLFANDKKGNDKAPDFKGKGLFENLPINIAAWKRTSASGIEYLSCTIENITAMKDVDPIPRDDIKVEQDVPSDVVSDEIPFNQDR